VIQDDSDILITDLFPDGHPAMCLHCHLDLVRRDKWYAAQWTPAKVKEFFTALNIEAALARRRTIHMQAMEIVELAKRKRLTGKS